MRRRFLNVGVPLGLVVTACALGLVPSRVAAQTGGLKIVVIEGEDAVNVVQQKSAVAPVVEVRDPNDQPVAGVLVRFAIRNGRATFGGARTLSVTTNAAGRAVAAGLTPTGSGALQIGASAAFQGQTAALTIAQTNVMTLAQAGAVTGAGVSGGSAGASTGAGGAAGGGAGGGTGGGLSATTLGIVGGAAAGGTLVAVKTARSCTDCGPGTGLYTGTFTLATVQTAQSLALVGTQGAVGNTCSWTLSIVVTMLADLDEDDHGNVTTGHFETRWTENEISRTCPATGPFPSGTFGPQTDDVDGQPVSNLRFNRMYSESPPGGGMGTRTTTFSGVLSGDTITGTFTMSSQATPQPGVTVGSPPTSGAVILQR